MKTFKLILLLMVLTIGTLFSQETVTLNVADLTQSQLEQIKSKKTESPDLTNVETASKYIGLGKEVGIAINEGLNSTIDAANKFGNTRVGTFTMNILAWKLLGKDITRVVLSVLLLFSSIWLLIYNIRKHSTHKVSTKGAWYQFWVTKEYEIVNSNEEGDFWAKIAFVILFLISVWIAYSILP